MTPIHTFSITGRENMFSRLLGFLFCKLAAKHWAYFSTVKYTDLQFILRK